MKIKDVLIFASIAGLLSACAPEEGKGGLASIEGKVMIQNLNSINEKSGDLYPAIDEDVFISYGNSNFADDKDATSFNGSFKFENLTKGDYTLFVYSDDTLSAAKNAKLTFKQAISLDSKKDEAKAEDFIIYKHMDYDDGNASVYGNVKEYICISATLISDSIPAQDYDVYLQYQNNDEIIDKYRTDANGNFVINNLIPGKYRVYVLSETSKLPADPDSAAYQYFEIKDNFSKITLPEIGVKNF